MAESQNAKPLFQLKITLLDIDPPIWRRIRVPDCTLDELHEYIQRAMGWTNSYTHLFEIGGTTYCHPVLVEALHGESECEATTATMIGQLVPTADPTFTLLYKYACENPWVHEITIEDSLPQEKGGNLAQCIAGRRACPPEEVDGPGEYADLLDASTNPDHDRHGEAVAWGASFDAEEFDPEGATWAMQPVAFLAELGIRPIAITDASVDEYRQMIMEAGGDWGTLDRYGSFSPAAGDVFYITADVARRTLSLEYHILLPKLDTLQHLLDAGPEPRRVADIGGGVGIASLFLAKYYPQCQVTVFDHAQRQLDLGATWAADRNMRNASFVLASYEHLSSMQHEPKCDLAAR